MNYSDRYIAILSGTTESGNSPHTVAETIRRYGLIDENQLPFDDTIKSWNDYYSPKPMEEKYFKLGNDFNLSFEFKHEWVFSQTEQSEKVRLIKEALKRSPVGMSVYAWGPQNENGVYQKMGVSNHWVCCYGYNDLGWKVFDSYDNTHKLYSFDADIEMAKLYYILPKPPQEVKGFWDFILSFFRRQ